jgi:hypothetical protein
MKRLRSFPCYGQTVRIRYQKVVVDDQERVMGVTLPTMNLIRIATHCPNTGTPLPEEVIEHTVGHEIAHYLMDKTGQTKLYHDEKYIDSLGGLLSQLLRGGRWR